MSIIQINQRKDKDIHILWKTKHKEEELKDMSIHQDITMINITITTMGINNLHKVIVTITVDIIILMDKTIESLVEENMKETILTSNKSFNKYYKATTPKLLNTNKISIQTIFKLDQMTLTTYTILSMEYHQQISLLTIPLVIKFIKMVI